MSRAWVAVCVAIAALVGSGKSLRAEEELDWDPAKTWVFAVGILEWQHADIWSSFPAAMKNRRDQQLVEFFKKAGVPAEQIVYLQDKAATKAQIEKEFVRLLDETDEGDLLVFYFAGHGSRDTDSGQTWFANYDAGRKDSSAWSVPRIFATIEKHFSGDRVLMFADCCHSGAMYDQAQKRKESDIAYAVITSSYSHNTSTGNWTFTDSLLAGLRGEPLVDLDGDGTVDLSEISRYTELELAFIEGQKSMFSPSADFSRKTKLAAVKGTVEPRVGQRIEVKYKDKWYRAKSIGVKGEQFHVHYAGYDNSWDEWVGPERVRPYQPGQFGEGDKVEVQWSSDQKWYPATVFKAWYGLHLVRYDGYDSTSDEWVGPRSVRLRTK